MMQPRIVSTDRAPRAIGPYSQATAAGDFVFTAGQIPLDPDTGELVAGDISAQTERVLENLRAVLTEAGSSFSHVLKTTVFLSDLGEFAAMNAVYERYFGAHKPARSTVQVAALPRGCSVEIECIAVRAER